MQENILIDLRVNKINAIEFKHMVEANITLLTEAFMSTVRTTAMIMLILLAAFTIQFAFARLGMSIEMAEWITGLDLSAVEFVLILVVFYLVFGTFMESYSMMMTTMPILLPSLIATDVDRLWFGIIMIILLEAAQISPPQALALYVLHGARNDVSSESATAEGVNAECGIRIHQRCLYRGHAIHAVHVGGYRDNNRISWFGHMAARPSKRTQVMKTPSHPPFSFGFFGERQRHSVTYLVGALRGGRRMFLPADKI